jgi:chemotaxis protein CheD
VRGEHEEDRMSAQSHFRSRDDTPRERVLHVVQGEYAVADEPGIVLNTILGSCVAACMRDSLTGIGGMNHFLLPGDENESSNSMRYGVNAMELLINALIQRGAVRSRLEAKLFGGANVMNNLSDIGSQNAAFAQKFLEAERILCVGKSLGGTQARRVRYWPETGRAAQLMVDPSSTSVLSAERAKPAAKMPPSGDLELF